MKNLCPNCDGKGFNILWDGVNEYAEDCAVCNGIGTISEKSHLENFKELSAKELANFLTNHTICDMCCGSYKNHNTCAEIKCNEGIKKWFEEYGDIE